MPLQIFTVKLIILVGCLCEQQSVFGFNSDRYIQQSEDFPIPDAGNVQNDKLSMTGHLDFEPKQVDDALIDATLLINEESPNDQNLNDMEAAETHVFRPLFMYRAQMEQKRRLQQQAEAYFISEDYIQ